jgi:EamA domain-containing membrane protein RarD
MPSITPVELCLALLILPACGMGGEAGLCRLAMSFLGFDLFIHMVMGFGINEVIHHVGLWLFCFTIAIAICVQTMQHTRRLHTPLGLFADAHTLSLAWNWWLLVDYLY